MWLKVEKDPKTIQPSWVSKADGKPELSSIPACERIRLGNISAPKKKTSIRDGMLKSLSASWRCWYIQRTLTGRRVDDMVSVICVIMTKSTDRNKLSDLKYEENWQQVTPSTWDTGFRARPTISDLKWRFDSPSQAKHSLVVAEIWDPLSRSTRTAWIWSQASLKWTIMVPSTTVELVLAEPANEVELFIEGPDWGTKLVLWLTLTAGDVRSC